MSYASVDDAIRYIVHLGPGTELIKIDLRMLIALFPSICRTTITWQDRTCVDRALPFGLRSVPKIFSAVADMLAWALHCVGIQHQIHYLDDFLFMVPPNQTKAHMCWQQL